MQRVFSAFEIAEQVGKVGMIHRPRSAIQDQVLLGHVGHVIALVVLSEQVIERLVLSRTTVFRDCRIPFIGVGELWIDIKHHPAKRMFAVSDNLSEVIFRVRFQHDTSTFYLAKIRRRAIDVHRTNSRYRKQIVNLTLTVLNVVAPVFLLAAVGFTWVKLGFEYRLEFVTRLSMTLAVPCLIFVALMQAEIDPAALSALSLASLVAYVGVTVAIAVLIKLTGLDQRTYLAPLSYGNTGNLGLPLALFAFGDLGLSYAVVVFAVMAILSFSFGIWVVSGGGGLGKLVREPMVAATLLGALFLWQGWETPLFLTNALDLIGQMAIPIMLITLGVAIARLTPSRVGRAVWLSAAKFVICTGIAWGTGLWFGLDPVAFGVLVVQLATPVAVTSYLLAEKYEADADAVAGLVVVSTLMSVALLSLLLAIVI